MTKPFHDLTQDEKIAWMLDDPDGYWAAARRTRLEDLARQEQPRSSR